MDVAVFLNWFVLAGFCAVWSLLALFSLFKAWQGQHAVLADIRIDGGDQPAVIPHAAEIAPKTDDEQKRFLLAWSRNPGLFPGTTAEDFAWLTAPASAPQQAPTGGAGTLDPKYSQAVSDFGARIQSMKKLTTVACVLSLIFLAIGFIAK